MSPTVGRIVYFNEDTGGGEIVQRASIITNVHDENHIDLLVFNVNYMESKVLVDQGEGADQWDWMPYQKGQAKKTEELEKELVKSYK